MRRPAPTRARLAPGGAVFEIWSGVAETVWLEIEDRDALRMEPAGDGVFRLAVPDLRDGVRYGYRVDGPFAPDDGHRCDPSKLLVDPYATELERPFTYHPDLGTFGADTDDLMPRAVLRKPLPAHRGPPVFTPGGLIYELNVRGFSMLHPDVPEEDRGTLRALTHPAIIAHLKRLGVDAIELMPITAWIDERHLVALGRSNAWGYNPATFMALDPRLAPGGIADLRHVTDLLREEGIGVILDLVFNHTGESDADGPTLSLRGIDNRAAFAHDGDRLINDTGTGNTVACNHPRMRALILEALRHFVREGGVDGFRFDLGPVLGRGPDGFDPDAPLLREMREDPTLADRILIMEPWDIGPGGYQLGRFGPPFLEWNDAARDDIRRFWRGDGGLGTLATRLAGSSDCFTGARTRSVNFIAAHDGFTLWDLVSHVEKHNHANGEENRDGHSENLSWNNGVEGASDDPDVAARRRRDVKALLGTLFASRGTLMLTAGDEFGRSQGGNNNAYAQDNETTWIDWSALDTEILAEAEHLSTLRRASVTLRDQAFLTDADVKWLRLDGVPMTPGDWEGARSVAMVLTNIAVCVNGDDDEVTFALQDQRQITVPPRGVRLVPAGT
ncbi:MAG: glycogen debranching protein GlgX [Pseudomonadota bacterium]